MASYQSGLRSQDFNRFERAVHDAVQDGLPGEAALIEALRNEPCLPVSVVAALGESTGGLAADNLRAIIRDARDEDMRCAGLLALAKQEGVGSSDLLTKCLDDPDESVSRYARLCLAMVGDGRAWTQVYAWLAAELQAAQPPVHPFLFAAEGLSLQSERLAAACYLGRYVASREPQERHQLINLMRSRWDCLYPSEQQWFAAFWPACLPGGAGPAAVDQPEPAALAAWISHPLLKPLHDTPRGDVGRGDSITVE